MKKILEHPLQAATFGKTFPLWGSFDRRQKASNLWHNPKIPLPDGFDYTSLNAQVHADQDAYRRWVVDILAYLFFQMALERPVVRYLELGCGDALEVHLFLDKFADIWEKGTASLEIHLLDDDATRLAEAAQGLEVYSSEKMKFFLWQGRLEDLESPDYLCAGNSSPKVMPKSNVFPEHFSLVFSQLALHNYPLFHLVEIFKSIYNQLEGQGSFILSDILYTGKSLYDALIWNRVLLQLEQLPEGPKRNFWLQHYQADYPTYQTRKDLMAALELVGFEEVEIVQCAYDMATIVGMKSKH